MVFRICVSGTSSYAPAGAGDGTRDTGNGATSAWTPAGTGATTARSRSRLITRPPGPDPWRSFRSTPVSFAMRFARGDAGGDHVPNPDRPPRCDRDLPQDAVSPRDQLHHGLVGLYLGQSVARFHRVALLLKQIGRASCRE